MGGIWTRWRQAPKTSREVLEKLDEDIKSFSKRRLRNQQYEKSFIGYLLVVSFLLYLVCGAVFYLYFLPETWSEGVIHSIPLLLFPLIVFLIKKLLNIYFTQRNAQYELQLRTFHEERRKVLNEVMEKETYRTAVELLRQYDPSHPALQQTPPTPAPQPHPPNQTPSQSNIRQRRGTPHPSTLSTPLPPSQHRPPPPPNPAPQPAAPRPAAAAGGPPPPPSSETLQQIPPGMCVGSAPGPPVPCPILPRERSSMDRFVEYLVGDGPGNRYALICSECHSHNGMALRDEFDYLSFRCAYCYHVNPARKTKPSLLRPDPAAAATPTTGDHVTSRDHTDTPTSPRTTENDNDATPTQQNEGPPADQQD